MSTLLTLLKIWIFRQSNCVAKAKGPSHIFGSTCDFPLQLWRDCKTSLVVLRDPGLKIAACDEAGTDARSVLTICVIPSASHACRGLTSGAMSNGPSFKAGLTLCSSSASRLLLDRSVTASTIDGTAGDLALLVGRAPPWST